MLAKSDAEEKETVFLFSKRKTVSFILSALTYFAQKLYLLRGILEVQIFLEDPLFLR